MDKTWLAAAGATFALAAAGCGGTAGKVAKGADFPVTVKAANGNIQIPRRPVRIVSISATATEDLFAVGAGPQVKAVDDYSTYPANAPRTRLSGYEPNAEAIAGYHPDLVVTADDTNHVVESLRKLGVPVLVDPPAKTLDDAYHQLEQLGAATGHAAQARGVVHRMRARVAQITDSDRARGRPLSVYHELDTNYYSATSQTFIGRIYRLLGVRNIADAAAKGGPYPKLSGEYVVKSNPDLIVLADTKCCGQSEATLRTRAGFERITAVHNRNVLAVADDVASQWGPRIVDFLALVAKRIAAMRPHA